MIGRRGFLLGLGALVTAPAIVRASSLMPLSTWRGPRVWYVDGLAGWEPTEIPAVVLRRVGTAWSLPFKRISEAKAVMRPGDTLFVSNTHFT